MKIRKYQWAGNIVVQDNTRVQRPLITTPIKRKLKSDEFFYNDHGTVRIGRYKNEQVSSDVRTEKQRKSDQSWADKKKKQMRMQQAQEQTARVANSIIEKTLPSYWVEKATGEDLGTVGRLAADMISPGKLAKGLSTAAILTMPIKGLKATKYGTHILEEGGKRLIAERVHPEWFSGISPELQREANAFLRFGQLNRPVLYNEIKDNKELMQFVKDIAEGKNQDILARFNETGVSPNLGSLIALKQTGLPQTKHVVIGQKGHSPIIGDWHNTKSMGNYNYFAGGDNAKWAAAQYADIGTPEQAHNLLINRGFTKNSPQYNYAMEEFSKINDLLQKKGVKRYSYKEGAKGRDGKPKNFSWEHLITKGPKKQKVNWTPEERDNYLQALENWTNFWGKDIESGGSRQVIARADNPLGYALVDAEGKSYKQLGGSPIQIPTQMPTKIELNTDANKLGKQLERMKQKLFKISTIDDPVTIDTYGSYGLPSNDTWFFQYKKGGKLNEGRNSKNYMSKKL